MLAAVALLSACSGGNDAPAPPIDTRPVAQSDVEIAQLLYTDARRTPQGFFQDAPPSGLGFVATSHLKNTDLANAATQFELCTDDWNTALTWSDQAATGAQASTLVETNATARFYEFGRVRSGTPDLYIRARVYRCAYLDRASVDLRNPTTTAGILNQRPLNAAELQTLSEYLWQFTSYNNYGNAVLASTGTTSSAALQHTLIIATLTPATTGTCDRVRVLNWIHQADTQSGALTHTTQTAWEFGARRVAGVVELCTP